MKLVWSALLFCCALRADMIIGSVAISGNHRLAAAAILQLIDLRNGTALTEKKLNTACRKLVDSGLFVSANYGYTPKKTEAGHVAAVTFTVREDTTLVDAVIDIDGVEKADVWSKLKPANGLLDPQMPDNDAAQSYYQSAIAAAFNTAGGNRRIVVKREADLTSGKMKVIFRDVDAATLSAVTFENNHALSGDTLEKAIHDIVIGQPYSERDLLQGIELNITPLYEEKGYLRSRVSRITRTSLGPANVSAAVSMDEERCWKLGNVDFVGDSLPVAEMKKAAELPAGEVANWRLITACLEKAQRVLRADGYLRVRADSERRFDESTGTVDLLVNVERGPQFRFGVLKFEGIGPDMQDFLSRRWKLRDGAPLDEPYTDEYWSQVHVLAGRSVKKVDKRLALRPGTNTIDVIYSVSVK